MDAETSPTTAATRLDEDPYTYWMTVDPEQATAWLESNIQNRSMRGRLVTSYARDMAGGRWLPTGESIKFARGGELIDGQHRLSAIVESGTPQRLLIVEGLPAQARSVIDTGAVRSGGDALRMAGVGGNSPHALAAAARLFALWESGRLTHYSSGLRQDDRASHAELIETVTRRPDLIDSVIESTRDYERVGMAVGPQAMARTVLADVDPHDANKFWTSLAGYATDGPDDPRAALLFTIRQLRAGGGEMRRPGVTVGLVFAAWNAWRDGQKMTTMAVRDSKGRPLKIPTPV